MKLIQRFSDWAGSPGASRPPVLAFLGDSVTQGCFELYRTGENSIETEFRSREAYHGKLKRMLEELYPNVPLTIVNAGISGDKAPSGLKRLQRDVLSFQPDLVVVCFGLNDSMFGLENLSNYTEALRGIFRSVQETGAEVIFMTPNMMATRVVAEEPDPLLRSILRDVARVQNEGILDAYLESARQVCAQEKVPLCDCYKIWKTFSQNGVDTTRLLSNRANHPKEAMHWLFAGALLQTIMN